MKKLILLSILGMVSGLLLATVNQSDVKVKDADSSTVVDIEADSAGEDAGSALHLPQVDLFRMSNEDVLVFDGNDDVFGNPAVMNLQAPVHGVCGSRIIIQSSMASTVVCCNSNTSSDVFVNVIDDTNTAVEVLNAGWSDVVTGCGCFVTNTEGLTISTPRECGGSDEVFKSCTTESLNNCAGNLCKVSSINISNPVIGGGSALVFESNTVDNFNGCSCTTTKTSSIDMSVPKVAGGSDLVFRSNTSDVIGSCTATVLSATSLNVSLDNCTGSNQVFVSDWQDFNTGCGPTFTSNLRLSVPYDSSGCAGIQFEGTTTILEAKAKFNTCVCCVTQDNTLSLNIVPSNYQTSKPILSASTRPGACGNQASTDIYIMDADGNLGLNILGADTSGVSCSEGGNLTVSYPNSCATATLSGVRYQVGGAGCNPTSILDINYPSSTGNATLAGVKYRTKDGGCTTQTLDINYPCGAGDVSLEGVKYRTSDAGGSPTQTLDISYPSGNGAASLKGVEYETRSGSCTVKTLDVSYPSSSGSASLKGIEYSTNNSCNTCSPPQTLDISYPSGNGAASLKGIEYETLSGSCTVKTLDVSYPSSSGAASLKGIEYSTNNGCNTQTLDISYPSGDGSASLLGLEYETEPTTCGGFTQSMDISYPCKNGTVSLKGIEYQTQDIAAPNRNQILNINYPNRNGNATLEGLKFSTVDTRGCGPVLFQNTTLSVPSADGLTSLNLLEANTTENCGASGIQTAELSYPNEDGCAALSGILYRTGIDSVGCPCYTTHEVTMSFTNSLGASSLDLLKVSNNDENTVANTMTLSRPSSDGLSAVKGLEFSGGVEVDATATMYWGTSSKGLEFSNPYNPCVNSACITINPRTTTLKYPGGAGGSDGLKFTNYQGNPCGLNPGDRVRSTVLSRPGMTATHDAVSFTLDPRGSLQDPGGAGRSVTTLSFMDAAGTAGAGNGLVITTCANNLCSGPQIGRTELFVPEADTNNPIEAIKYEHVTCVCSPNCLSIHTAVANDARGFPSVDFHNRNVESASGISRISWSNIICGPAPLNCCQTYTVMVAGNYCAQGGSCSAVVGDTFVYSGGCNLVSGQSVDTGKITISGSWGESLSLGCGSVTLQTSNNCQSISITAPSNCSTITVTAGSNSCKGTLDLQAGCEINIHTLYNACSPAIDISGNGATSITLGDSTDTVNVGCSNTTVNLQGSAYVAPSTVTLGGIAPGVCLVPGALGQVLIDTTGCPHIYMSSGTASNACWHQIYP
jgi:hypothetical protein